MSELLPPPEGQARREWMAAHSVVGALPKQAYTSWIRRVGAFIVDQLVYMVFAVFVGGLAGLVVGATGGSSRVEGIAQSIAGLLILAYWFWNWGHRQGTTGSSVGKWALRFKVVDDRDGQPIGFGRSILRQLAHFFDSLILGIGYLLPLFTSKRQTIADMMMSTVCLPIQEPF